MQTVPILSVCILLHDVLFLIKAAVTMPDSSNAGYWDSNLYDGTNPTSNLPQGGLSECTNANFLIRSTVFTEGFLPVDAHYFPYPRKASTILFDEVTASGARRESFFFGKIPDRSPTSEDRSRNDNRCV